jgi:hypothetical protein
MEGMMRKLSILIGLLLILAVAVLPAGAITWGEPDAEHTNVGAMVVDWPDYGPWQWCSGTLIYPPRLPDRRSLHG